MPEYLRDPRRLRHVRDKLLERQADPKRELARIETLAECNFRLAVHPDTPAGESVTLLRQSYRLDGANPKHAYHLGRIYFAHGRLDEAAHWLRVACCLSPTSHRIWAHVGMLQSELNQRYAYNDLYDPNALLKRSERISEAILQGRDALDAAWLDFVPPKSLAAREREQRHGDRGEASAEEPQRGAPASENGHAPKPPANVRRLVRPGVCRWNGVRHMQVEHLLRGRASAPVLKQLAPAIEEVAALAKSQRRLQAAFVVLAVQWLVCGYPVATIRRLMATWTDPPSGPGWELLSLVCELFELPPEELPARLARGVQEDRLPALLAAVIHQRRLLWRPLEFRGLTAYRAARQIMGRARLAAAENGEAEQLKRDAEQATQRLLRAIEAMWPSPAKPLADEPPRRQTGPAMTVELAAARFEDYVRGAAQLDAAREEAFAFLKEDLEAAAKNAAGEEQMAQAVADRAAFQELLAEIEAAATRGTAELESLLKQISQFDAAAMGADFESRSDQCGKVLKECCNAARFLKVLKRIDKSLPQPLPASAAAPAARIGQLRTRVREALPPPATEAELDAGPLDAARACSLFEVLERAAAALTLLRDEGFAVLKEGLAIRVTEIADEASFSLARADRGAIESLVAALKSAGEEGIAQLESLQSQIVHLDNQQLGSDFNARREACKNSFVALTSLANYQKVLRRVGQQLDPLSERFQLTACEPTPPLGELVVRVQQALPHQRPAAKSEPQPALQATPDAPPKVDQFASAALPPLRDLVGLPGLRQAVNRVDEELERLFGMAHATFEAYPPWCRLLPPIHALEASVHAREAETLFRLGRTADARRKWNQMLRRDPEQEPVLRNLAVCDTLEGDIGRSPSSWRRYLSALYRPCIFAGDPSERAAQRVQFHRAMGRCHAPPFLSAKMDGEWSQKIDAPALLSFLISPQRVRGLIDHLILEYFNSRFEFHSPALKLGIKRVEAERLREPAAARMLEFIGGACELLPERIAGPLGELARTNIQDAVKHCQSLERLRLSSESDYAEEERRQIDILIQIIGLRLKLVIAFQNNADLVKHLTSLDFLTHLERIGKIPIEQSAELLKIASNSLGLDEEMLGNLPELLRNSVVFGLMRFLLASSDDDAERAVRQRQYKQLVEDWVRLPVLKDDLKSIEEALNLLPKDVVEALNGDSSAAIPHMRRYAEAFPAFGGIARLLAQLLANTDQCDEAEAVIRRAREHAFLPSGLAQLDSFLVRLNAQRMQKYWDDEAFEQAMPCAREMISLDDAAQPGLLHNCLMVFIEAATRLQQDPGHEEIGRLVDAWMARALARRNETPPEGEDHFTVNDEELAKLRELAGLAKARMILGPLGDPQTADGDRVVAQMNALLKREPELVGAYFCRALGWFSKANAATAAGSASSRRNALTSLISDMTYVEQHAVDESLRRQATALRQNAESNL